MNGAAFVGVKEVLPRDPHGRRVRTGSSGHPNRSEVAVFSFCLRLPARARMLSAV